MSDAQYWAQIGSDNKVMQVMVVHEDFMAEHPEMFEGAWVQTYFDTEGKTFASVGYVYDKKKDDFTEPEMNPYWKQAVGWVE